MKELQELRNEVLSLRNMGEITKQTEIILLHKLNALKAAINYTHSCKSDSEQLHTEVFNLANKLAINGYGNEAVKMHGICNGM